MRKLDSFRIEEHVLSRLKSICVRHGDKTYHVEQALISYLDSLDKPKKVVKKKAAKKEESLPDGFDEFWSAYPRKKDGKPMAIKAWVKVGPDQKMVQVILKDIKARVADGEWLDPQFVPMPQTYLNQERWSGSSRYDAVTKKVTYL